MSTWYSPFDPASTRPCPRCGTPLALSEVVCPSCGALIAAAPPQKADPQAPAGLSSEGAPAPREGGLDALGAPPGGPLLAWPTPSQQPVPPHPYPEAPTSPPRSFRSLLVWGLWIAGVGLLAGGGLGVFLVLPGLGSAGQLLDFAGFLFLSGYLGYRASASRRKIGPGLLVGLFLGLSSLVALLIFGLIYGQATSKPPSMVEGVVTMPNLDAIYLASSLMLAVVVLFLTGFVGGTLGGAVGKGRPLIPTFALSTLSLLLAGGILGAYFGFVVFSLGLDWRGLLLGALTFPLLCGCLGYEASFSAGTIGSGGRIGFLLGLVSAVVLLVVGVIVSLVQSDQWLMNVERAAALPVPSFWILAPLFLALVAGTGVLCLIGLGAGTLGGAIGKRRWRALASPLPVQESRSRLLPPLSPPGSAPPPPPSIQQRYLPPTAPPVGPPGQSFHSQYAGSPWYPPPPDRSGGMQGSSSPGGAHLPQRQRPSRRRLVWSVLLAGLVIIALATGLAWFAFQQTTSTGSITEFPLPSGRSFPLDITAGPDGNLWFTEYDNSKIGRISPSGTITEFPLPSNDSQPDGITAGPDGNLWFTEYGSGKIGRISPSGTVTEFPLPSNDSQPDGITAGPDGNLWFTVDNNNTIGRISPSGTITEFPLPSGDGYGSGDITAGPDGNLWFIFAGNIIGRISPSGTVTEFPFSTSAFLDLGGITAGPDGNLWFTEGNASKVGRISPSGTITEFPLPSGFVSPLDITAGPDGNLWFTEQDGDTIGRISLSGTITGFSVPTFSSELAGITVGPDGNLWFTEYGSGKIGRITPGK